MQHTDQQLAHSDVNALKDFMSWESFVFAIVLVLVNWVLVILWLSIPPAQAKPVERPLQVDALRVSQSG